jgi:hypothetical protein
VSYPHQLAPLANHRFAMPMSGLHVRRVFDERFTAA